MYDFREHYEFHFQQWLDSFETGCYPDFKEIYQGVDAVTDVPPAFWFEEISAIFPEAKVIFFLLFKTLFLLQYKEHY